MPCPDLLGCASPDLGVSLPSPAFSGPGPLTRLRCPVFHPVVSVSLLLLPTVSVVSFRPFDVSIVDSTVFFVNTKDTFHVY